jgi:DNA-binding PucR family transcriptional regulator
MSQYERLILMAEDELTQYSTDARKIEKLRQKIGLSVSAKEQQQVKETLLAEMPTDSISQLIEKQRQTVALPFWGIAGLGLLFGISFMQPLDFIATLAGGAIAIYLQKMGWKLQAQRLVLQTLEDIEQRTRKPENLQNF